jgi:hypothetical protein
LTATSVRHDDRTDVLGVGVSSINLNDGGRDHPTLDQRAHPQLRLRHQRPRHHGMPSRPTVAKNPQ